MAVVGAGFTGLWTAYYLKRLDPSLRIAVLERDIAGFGASGRNGGWCSDLFPASWPAIARSHGRHAALAMKSAMRASIDAVEGAVSRERTWTATSRAAERWFARSVVQLDRARSAVRAAREWGDTDEDLRLLDADEVAEIAGVAGTLGATYTPHCAAIDPAALVRGLAELVVDLGVELYEATEVTEIRPHRVVTPHGTVRAEVVVRATEAYTAALPGARRDLAPVYSLIVATEPLPTDVLNEVGLGRPTDVHRPPPPGLLRPAHRRRPDRVRWTRRAVSLRLADPPRLRPGAASLRLAAAHSAGHVPGAARGRVSPTRWGGPLGVPRDWHAGSGWIGDTGFAWAGGYVGDGVTTSNLAGRTLADLITGTDPGADHVALGRTSLAPLGAGTVALPGHQRRPQGDERGRRRRGPLRPAVKGGPHVRPVARRVVAIRRRRRLGCGGFKVARTG